MKSVFAATCLFARRFHAKRLCFQLTQLVRGPLEPTDRKKIIALITTDVHGRDVAMKLRDNLVSHTNNFVWQQQLRFYWDENDDDCIVRQVRFFALP